MEQPISPNIKPVHVAATDPAFVPGITPPPADEAAETANTETEATEETPETPEDAAQGVPEADAEVEADADAESPEEDGSDADDSETPDGPVLEAADRRGSVTADRDGIRFQLDDQEAEFDWDEIGAVEYDTSRFGRWLTITVHLIGPRRRYYEADVEAPAKSRLRQWTTQLDEVLDAYFEDAEDDQDAEEAQDAEDGQDGQDTEAVRKDV